MIDMSFDRLCVHIFECETDMRILFFWCFFTFFGIRSVVSFWVFQWLFETSKK